MSNFLRGGQVTAHKFRMTLQVVRIMTYITCFLMLFTIFITLKNNINTYHWRMIPAIAAKYTFQDLNPEKIVTYKNKWGVEVKERVKYLSRNRDFISAENHFIYVLIIILERLVWVMVATLSVALLYFWYRGKSLQENKKKRGSFLVESHELKAEVLKANRKFYDLQSYTLAGIPYPATGKGNSYTPGEQAHTLILGATGSGKTKVIQDLVSQIDKNNGKAVIIDIKGDYIKHFYRLARGDIILNPLDLRGSNWSFFKETNELTGFDTIAKILIPNGYGDSFWTNAARILFSELANLYKDRDLSIAEFAREVSTMKLGAMEKLLENTRASHLVNQKAEKTAICILMMLSIYLAPFKLYNKTHNIFSIREWVNDPSKNNFLFISTSPEVKGSLNPLVQMQVDLAVNALCSLKNDSNQKIWFILDELAYFDGGIQSLKDGLTISRSFGGAFVLGVQDLSSLSKIYGSDLSRVIANNCRNKFIMNVDDSYTSKWCSDLFGEGEVEEWQEGFSYGAHQHRDGVNSNKTTQVKRTILPSQFSQLATGSGYMKLPGFHPALVQFKDFYLEGRDEAFIENPSLKEILVGEMKKAQYDKVNLEDKISAVGTNIKDGRSLVDEVKTNNDLKDKEREDFI